MRQERWRILLEANGVHAFISVRKSHTSFFCVEIEALFLMDDTVANSSMSLRVFSDGFSSCWV